MTLEKHKPALIILLYAAGIAFAVLILVVQAYSVQNISHDDGISYLAATGHQALYNNSSPSHQWTRAGSWQAFWTPDNFWRYGTISTDLATYDIHPPLYFWILHTWVSIFGVTLASGPLLNMLFHIAAMLGIFLACRILKCSTLTAGTAGLCWLLGGACLSVGAETRHYSALSANTALFIAALLYFYSRPALISSLLLCLAGAAGLLTHYQFILVILVCGAAAFVQFLLAKNYRPILLLASCLFLTALIFCALNPLFYQSFERQSAQAQPFSWNEVPGRLHKVITAFFEIFIPLRLSLIFSDLIIQLRFMLPVLVLIASCACLAVVIIKRQLRKNILGWLQLPDSIPAVGTAACFCAIVILYLLCKSPRHAMGVKYLMLVTPILFIVLGQVIEAFYSKYHKFGLIIVLLLLASQLAYGSLTLIRVMRPSKMPAAISLLKDGDTPLVLDSAHRGVLPGILWHAHPDKPVFASRQDSLVKDFPVLPHATKLMFVSNDIREYGNTPEGRDSLLQCFREQGFTIMQRLEAFRGSEVYLLRKSTLDNMSR
jgi:uncharacterized membrane protein